MTDALTNNSAALVVSSENQVVPTGVALGRRGVVVGGLLFGAALLTGCTGARTAAGKSSSVAVSNGAMVRDVPRSAASMTPPAPARPQVASVSVLPRSAWTRSGIARPSEAFAMNGVRSITVHHSGVDSGSYRSQSAIARHIESIRATHVKNGWADIGYHYIVDPQGRVWEGRAISKQGAHVKDQNENNLGVMLLGNYDSQRPTREALSTLQATLIANMRRFRVPTGRVYTHQELRPTACPGRNLQSPMNQLRSRGGALAAVFGAEATLA